MKKKINVLNILSKVSSTKVLQYLLALCLLSSLFPFVVYGKYLAFVAMSVMMLMNTYKGMNVSLLLFCAWAMLCSIVNGVWGGRDVAWIVVLLSATSMIGHSLLSISVLKSVFKLLPLFVATNLLAYIFNINYFYILYQEPDKFCFSGLTSHPQWLGAFTGLACVYTYYHAVIEKKGDRLRGVMAIVFFLMSVELGLLAGSRSALLSAGVAIILMTYFTCDGLFDFIKRTGVVIVLAVFLLPVFLQSLEMIENKQWAQSQIGHSRSRLWFEQFMIIVKNPFWGVGLVRGESGNGWLAVAAQTGMLGFCQIIAIVCHCFLKGKKYMQNNKDVMLLMCILSYLIIHGCFEGYILTPGYLMCWIFWASVGNLLSVNRLNSEI